MIEDLCKFVKLNTFCPADTSPATQDSEQNTVMKASPYLQTGLLGGQVGAPAHRAQLYGGHGAADVQVLSVRAGRLHLRDTAAAADGLRRVLQAEAGSEDEEDDTLKETGTRTCPQAMKMAATMLAAWALKPPTLPAMAEPTRFLLTFSSTRAAALLFSTCAYVRRSEAADKRPAAPSTSPSPLGPPWRERWPRTRRTCPSPGSS